MSAMARSAVASVSTPGVLPTATLRSAAASRSMLSVPTARLATARTLGAASKSAASTRSVSIVRRASLPAAFSRKASGGGGDGSGQTSTSCAARRRSSAGNGSSRVTSTRAIAGILSYVDEIRIGCSGWNYRDWRERVYPSDVPVRRWLAHYATLFDTVEINNTFYRLAKPKAVATWVADTPDDFVFAVKASQYLTHMKRLRDIRTGIGRFFDAIEPLVGSPKLGPVLWQLPERMTHDEALLAAALDDILDVAPPARHCFEFRHPSWFTEPVLELLRWHRVALAIGDHPERPWQPWTRTADWSFVRFHYGARGRRGNYSETELEELADRIVDLAGGGTVYAYFNNDWEGFAPRNAQRLRTLVGAR